MLCSSILGGIEEKGKGRERDNETKEAAVDCIWALVHGRTPQDDPLDLPGPVIRSTFIQEKFAKHAQTEKFVPVLGQTIHHLLTASGSPHRPLQRRALETLHTLVRDYISDEFAPSILPGVVSAMCKCSLGAGTSRGWANGDVVVASLLVLQEMIVRTIGNEICIREGVVRDVRDLEDLAELFTDSTFSLHKAPVLSRFGTTRTPSWLQGTTSQLHIALNSLHPLISHPTSSALQALAIFSSRVLASTSLTLPQSRPLLISFLLSVASSDVESAVQVAKHHLSDLLESSETTRHTVLQALLQIFKDNLSALPRLIQTMAESRAERAALLIEAICGLPSPGKNPIAAGVGYLLGPNGGVERWGWQLLSVLDIVPPQVSIAKTSTVQLMLETGEEPPDDVIFPEFTFKNVPSSSTRLALERMFRSLGQITREDSLFTIEWFVGIGQGNRSGRGVVAFWCAARLLEGVGSVSLSCGKGFDSLLQYRSKRVERFARDLTRRIAEAWDKEDQKPLQHDAQPSKSLHEEPDTALVEYTSGLTPIRFTLTNKSNPAPSVSTSNQPLLHMAISLQLFAISAGILQVRFSPLLLYALYPVLHSLIAPPSHLSATALATLQYISNATSYGSPANMLLANFDYALDSVSRHLSRRWLDVDATHVLLLLVRFVGHDVVQRASDVVEECFDRLDEYHGYEVIVDGLVAVLSEVVQVIASDGVAEPDVNSYPRSETCRQDNERLAQFTTWFTQRGQAADKVDDDETEEDFGPVPQRAWGKEEKDPENEGARRAEDPTGEIPPTPTQELTKQIVTRSMYFLTHRSALIRSQILTLLGSAASMLPESAILPSIHQAWPFILNRFSDPEPFVVSAAAQLVESLATHVGDFMSRRIWDDIWPRFNKILTKLHVDASTNALTRRGPGAVGTVSAYTHSHRLYRALLRTMTAAAKGVHTQDNPMWEVIVAFRRFLHAEAHEELQACARELYSAIARNNEDAVWFALSATQSKLGDWTFLEEGRWDITANVKMLSI